MTDLYQTSGSSPTKLKRSRITPPRTVEAPAVEPLLITVKQAAALLSVSTSEVRILCRKGFLSYRRMGQTHWLVSMRSVKQFAEGGKAAA